MKKYGVRRLTLFGSCASGSQGEGSDNDIFVEFDPLIGLEYATLVEELESLLGGTWSRCSPDPSRTGDGGSSKRNWWLSERPTGILIEDILEAMDKIDRYVSGMDLKFFRMMTEPLMLWCAISK